MSDLKYFPMVSVIIPTLNSEKELSLCLKSLKNQSYDNIEIIIADGYSTDRTVDIGVQYGAKIYQKKCSFTQRRNYGATKANGDIYYHMDSDMILPKNLIKTAVKKINTGYDGVIIPQRFAGKGFFGKCKELEIISSTDSPALKICRFMKKKVFFKINGYDEQLEAGEDWDITQRIENKYNLGKIHTYIIHGWGSYNISKWIRKCYKYGKSIYRYKKKHPTLTKYQWGPARLISFNWRLLLKYPHYALGILFIKNLEFISGLLGSLNSRRV